MSYQIIIQTRHIDISDSIAAPVVTDEYSLAFETGKISARQFAKLTAAAAAKDQQED